MCLQVADLHAKALAEDALVFDYDTHYDAIQEERQASKRHETFNRKSRYVTGLLEKAEERRREQEVLNERRIRKEQEAEAFVYGEKERFVTSAYRKKLEEEAKWKQERAKKQAEEEANAVEKRGHMGDFYRNLFRSNVAFGAQSDRGEGGKHEHVSDRDLYRRGLANSREVAEASPPGIETDGVHDHRRASPEEHKEHETPESNSEPSMRVSGEYDRSRNGTRREFVSVEPSKAMDDHVERSLVEERQTELHAQLSEAKQSSKGSSRQEEIAAARERYLARKRLKTEKDGGEVQS